MSKAHKYLLLFIVFILSTVALFFALNFVLISDKVAYSVVILFASISAYSNVLSILHVNFYRLRLQ